MLKNILYHDIISLMKGDSIMKEVGQRLKSLREGIKLSQVKMAGILGVQQSAINRFETGKSTPSAETLIKYADYFDVSLDYIFARTDRPQGKEYRYEPKLLKEKTDQNEQIREFVEMCFDPKSPVSEKLKAVLIRLMMEEQK